MPTETVTALAIQSGGTYVDGTTGLGGHSQLILKALGPKGKLFCFDQDGDILGHLSDNLTADNRVELIHSNFRFMKDQLQERGVEEVNGILLDLGVSSPQLDEANRGFSYRADAPLDMRMDRRQELTAAEIVNNYSEKELANIFYRYGEESRAQRIARRIINEREKQAIETTLELADLIRREYPAKERRDGHPARKVFQALRIAVNRELEALEEVLPQALDILTPGGRLVIITFHSLEDRIVKQYFNSQTGICTCPPGLPICSCGATKRVNLPRPAYSEPTGEEIAGNPRARSAKMRWAEKI